VRWLAIALSLAATAAASGCDRPTPTEVMVHLDAQPGARAAARTLEVRVVGHDGTMRLEETRALDPGTAWPLRLPLVPLGGDPSRGWAVEATLRDASDAVVAVGRLRGGYVEGSLQHTLLCLFDGCASSPCGSLAPACVSGGTCETCRTGACIDATALLDAVQTAPRCPVGTCTPSGIAERACDDGVDDDCDTRVDCADPDCLCGDGGTCTPTGTEDTVPSCHDGADNDCDGLVDCAEGGVCIFDEGPDGCSNGIDDDCDGLIDCLDLACCAAPSCDQRACGANGLVCCAGACVNTWSSEVHCGACSTPCGAGRSCVRVPAGDGTNARGAACRCAVGAGECPPGFSCELHDGVELCNCPGDLRCAGPSVCEMPGAARHSYCSYP
jgi:hypothetical protein